MNLRDIQQATLKILCIVDSICKKAKVQYFIDSGTLLGAIRHNGFIPWDDDVDIIMHRAEYEKLKKYCLSEKMPESLEFVNADACINGYFYDFIPRFTVIDSRSHAETDIDKQYDNLQNRLCVDIFILDTVPKSNLGFLLYMLILKFFYGLAMGHRGILKPQKNGFLVFLISNIGKLFPLKWIISSRERFIKMFSNIRSSKIMPTNYIIRDLGITFQKKCFQEVLLIPFETEEFPAPKEFDKVLTDRYGDYMTPPPEEQRIPEHILEGYVIPDWLKQR